MPVCTVSPDRAGLARALRPGMNCRNGGDDEFLVDSPVDDGPSNRTGKADGQLGRTRRDERA